MQRRTARAVRAQTTSLRTREHVDVAKLSGARTFGVIVREILPYMASYVVMAFVLQLSSGILNEAGLSLLGLGPSQSISLGKMLQNALQGEALRTGAYWAASEDEPASSARVRWSIVSSRR